MAKYRQVPKSLVSFNADDLSDDTELIAPELLFDDFDSDNSYQVKLDSPESLFGRSTVKQIKLKSPEELFGKFYKNNGHKNLSVKKDKKSGK